MKHRWLLIGAAFTSTTGQVSNISGHFSTPPSPSTHGLAFGIYSCFSWGRRVTRLS